MKYLMYIFLGIFIVILYFFSFRIGFYDVEIGMYRLILMFIMILVGVN